MADGGQVGHTTPLARLGIAVGCTAAACLLAMALVPRRSAVELGVAIAALVLSLAFIVLAFAAERTVRTAISNRSPGLLESYGVGRHSFGWISRSRRLLRTVADPRIAADSALVEDVARFRSFAWASFGLFTAWGVALLIRVFT